MIGARAGANKTGTRGAARCQARCAVSRRSLRIVEDNCKRVSESEVAGEPPGQAVWNQDGIDIAPQLAAGGCAGKTISRNKADSGARPDERLGNGRSVVCAQELAS